VNTIVTNKGWHLEVCNTNIILSKNGVNIIDSLNDYYDLIKSLSEYLKKSEGPKCIKVHNTENKATAVIRKKNFKGFYEFMMESKDKVDKIYYKQSQTIELKFNN
jgi:hypothetical protein